MAVINKDIKNVLDIAQNIKGPYFKNPKAVKEGIREIFWVNADLEDEAEEIQRINQKNNMLYQIVLRCVNEQFPIEEYDINEIPYSDESGWLLCFIHQDDFIQYKKGLLPINKVRLIDFFSEYSGFVTPMKLIYKGKGNAEQYETSSCEKAVYYMHL